MATNDSGDGKSDGSIDYKNPEDLREAYWDRGMTLEEIVEESEAGGATTLRYHMDKNGIDRRDRSEMQRNIHAGLSLDGSGYMTWYSVDPDKQRSMKVHRLLAVAMYGTDAVVGKHAHHENGIPWDNRPDNIELKRPSEHHSHHSTGESHSQAKLSKQDVEEIDRLLKEGELTQIEISDRFGVSASLITAIKTGRNWTHITGR